MTKKKIFSLCLTISVCIFIFLWCILIFIPQNSTIYNFFLKLEGCNVIFVIVFLIAKASAEHEEKEKNEKEKNI